MSLQRRRHVEVVWKWVFEQWTGFYCSKLFPLNSPSQKSTHKPQSYQRVSSLHIARKTHAKPSRVNGLQGKIYSMMLLQRNTRMIHFYVTNDVSVTFSPALLKREIIYRSVFLFSLHQFKKFQRECLFIQIKSKIRRI